MNNNIKLYQDSFYTDSVLLVNDIPDKIYNIIIDFYEENKHNSNINLLKFSKNKYYYPDSSSFSMYNFVFTFDKIICEYNIYNHTFEIRKDVFQKTTNIHFIMTFPFFEKYDATENTKKAETLIELYNNTKNNINMPRESLKIKMPDQKVKVDTKQPTNNKTLFASIISLLSVVLPIFIYLNVN